MSDDGKLEAPIAEPQGVTLWVQALIGFVGKERGAALGLRARGEELLFASRDQKPLRWVKVGEFNADPRGILTGDDLENLKE